MVDLSTPDCEARITPELIALFRNRPAATGTVSHSGRIGPEICGSDEEARSCDGVATGRCGFPWRPFRLRRDGRPPLTFHGLLVATREEALGLSTCGISVSVRRTTALYTTEAGTTVAHVTCWPPEGHAARPVHRASILMSAADLASLLEGAGVEACFAVSPNADLGLAANPGSNGSVPAVQ